MYRSVCVCVCVCVCVWRYCTIIIVREEKVRPEVEVGHLWRTMSRLEF